MEGEGEGWVKGDRVRGERVVERVRVKGEGWSVKGEG